MSEMFDMYDNDWLDESEGVQRDEDGIPFSSEPLDEDNNDDEDVS